MECYNCGAALTGDTVCPGCGIQIKVYKQIIYSSNRCYNNALFKAQTRDLSGAIKDLQLSLKYNKMNIPARNLLGLIYYETGDTVSALGEWVISRSLQPEKNIAEEYLTYIQKNQTQLDNVNMTIKKYNQALAYCRQGSEDLAIIQLKKLLSTNSKLLCGHQLLALLCMKEGEFVRAKRSLENALKIDSGNPRTLRYLKEVNTHLHIDEKEAKKAKKREELVSYQSGNETIIQPQTSFKETSPFMTVINIIIGIVIGIMVTAFLIVPGVRQNVRSEANSAVNNANDTITTKDENIKSLNSQIEDLNDEIKELEEEKSENDSKISTYEQLLSAYAAFSGGDVETAGAALANVNVDYLGQSSKTIYDQINAQVNQQYLETMYTEGQSAYNRYDYEAAATALQAVVDMDESYHDGYAIYYLAQSCRKIGNTQKALEYYRKVAEQYPNTSRAATAQRYITELEEELGESGVQPEEDEDTQNPDRSGTMQDDDEDLPDEAGITE